jgi:poly(A) polymerase
MEEDAQRRDFTFNALYYDPEEEIVVDYVGGFTDIKKKRVIPVIPLAIIFKDDPVRMIRAAKYAASTGFKLPLLLRWRIKTQAALLDPVSPSRLTEEIVKIVRSGNAAPIIQLMGRLGLFVYLQPNAAGCIKADSAYGDRFMNSMSEMDKIARKDPDAATGTLLAFLLRDFLETVIDWKSNSTESYRKALAECRSFVLPMNPPRVELENAVRILFRESGVPVKKARTFEKGQRNELVPDLARGIAKTDLIALDGDAPVLPKKRRRRRTRKSVANLRSESPEKETRPAED